MKYDTITVSTTSGGKVGDAFDAALKLASRRGIQEITRVDCYATEAEQIGGEKHIVAWDITVEGRVAV